LITTGLARTRVKSLPGRLVKEIDRQIKGVAQGGWSVLRWKAQLLLPLPLAVLAVIIARALRPLVLVRFRSLSSTKIGQFAGNNELYLCERDAGMHPQKTVDLFYHLPPVCNQQLKKMWNRQVRVSFLAASMDLVNRRLPGGERHVIPVPSDKDFHGLLARYPVHLTFTSQEESLGLSKLRSLGVSEGSPFICLYARDSAYMDEISNTRGLFHYHDFRDSTIQNYLPAAEELARRGYFAVRMGSIVKEAMNTGNPMIIDYATKARTDFLDIFLPAKCGFFLGDTGGLTAIPRAFRRPMVYANLVFFEPSGLLLCAPDSLFIPKKLWLRKDHRFMTFPEIVSSGVGGFLHTEEFDRLGVDVLENTPEEITAVALEMEERLKGTWAGTAEDEELQRRFQCLFKLPEWPNATMPQMGAEFLRQNRDLMD